MTRTVILALFCASFSLCSTASAETRFGIVLKKHISARTVACTTCHPNAEDRTELTAFGLDVQKTVEGKDLIKLIEDAKEADAEEKKSLYEKVDKEFLESLKKLDKMKAPSGKTYAEALKAGEIEGIKLRK